ncbi:peptidoglycan-N-acetylmuramic acid deacetylase PdaC [Siminovitchia terrae]|uniref:polysaccharide deacetylase family protein n=1 Tax=Siminovitchia terrae TaxID=1914933 RepID=UPI001B0BEE7E|nr:polysaccharide deacetylase family protein [Siminovitchia terrae]GIN89450.1 peptidoglycan-N-acetylmuramic acid deacetylase PdaC [Siminovitchia terrae]
MSLIKRIKWPGWIVFILLIGIIMSVFYQSIGTKKVIANNYKIKNSIITTTYSHDVSELPGLNLQTETEVTNKYTMFIGIPTVDSEMVNTPIHKWIEQQKKEFKEDVKQNDNQLGNGDVAHLNIQLDTKNITDEIYSLLFTVSRYTGGTIGQQTIKPFTIDMKQNKILKFTDIINMDDEASKEIQKLIKEEIKKDNDSNFNIMEDLLEETLRRFDDLKWIISEKALTIYFDEYEITGGAEGVIEVEIPFEKLDSYINDSMLMKGQEPKHKEEKKEHGKKELDPNGKYIALTFDDGPYPKVTPRVLEVLLQYEAKATFFMLGKQVEYYPTIAEQVAKAGHEIASHSYSHTDLTKLSNEAIKQEFNETSNKIETATGMKPTLFRPPYGAYNDEVINYANNNGDSIILWSVDSLDWKSLNASAVINTVTRDVTNGSIVLLHDIHESTADALPELLASLRNQGYQFITVSELIALQKEKGVGPHFGKVS